jgi:putative ABC transport system ATP-binding protein
VISLEGLVRIFLVGDHEVRALAGVSLEIADGEHLAIMGPSGSGKSTLLHILGLLDRPTSGRYRLDGRDVTDLDDDEQARTRREKIGFVFQFFHLVPYLTAAENVELPMMLAGIAPSVRHPRVVAALEGMGLADRMEHRPEQLSGGQRQRVAIARATVMAPAVLLADEPTGNLDRRSGEDVMRILEGLNRDGITLIVVTHDPEVAARAPRCVRMLDGVIAEDVRS